MAKAMVTVRTVVNIAIAPLLKPSSPQMDE